jgi:hypothetical protein
LSACLKLPLLDPQRLREFRIIASDVLVDLRAVLTLGERERSSRDGKRLRGQN